MIRKYFRLTITLFITVSLAELVYGALSASRINDLIEHLDARLIVQSDYDMIDTAVLEDAGGWMEILDENYDVIYTKGNVQEVTDSYTAEELFSQMSAYNIWTGETRGLINILSVTIRRNYYDYYATAIPFTDTSERKLVCVTKIPVHNVHTTLTFSAFNGHSFRIVNILAYALSGTALLIFILLFMHYLKGVRTHLQRPNKKLVDSLEIVTRGNYDVKLHLNAEYEYNEIEKSFNFMVQDLKESRHKNQVYEQERQQLFSSIAHDLRTPVTSIKGCAQALSEGIVTEKTKQQEYLQTIQNKSGRISELMELLMVYTKLNHSEFELKKESLDFCEYVLTIVAENYNEAEKHGMDMEPEIPETEIIVEIDRVEFGRVLTNLLTNAMRHNPEGTIIRPVIFKNDTDIILQIWDNGTLIPEGMVPTLFNPFVLGDASRTSRNGSGLGLSVCRKIVEKHEGTIELRTEGNRKCFHIALPLTS